MRPATLFLLLAMAIAPAVALPGQRTAAPVVLLSIDGLKPDYVIEADKHQLKIPNLRRLLKSGAYATGVRGVLPTVTYPSHATMVTGVAPARHGIYYNTSFDPMNKNQTGWQWYAEDIRVDTLWHAAARARMVTASVDWPVSVSAPVTWNIAQYWRATTEDDRKLLRALSTPGLLSEAERACGAYPAGDDYTVDADKKRADFIAWVLENKKPRFLTCYFGGLDTDEHQTGPYSAKTFESLERLDELVGKVWAAAEKSGGGRAVMCVVSDHGFVSTTREVRLNAALKEAGLIELDGRGRVKSWLASGWGGGGTSAIVLKDARDEATRGRVRAVLERLAADPEAGVLRILDGEEARRIGGFPDAAFVLALKPGWGISGNLELPIVAPLARTSGNHGYLPELPEMESSFFIAGPGVEASYSLGRIDMRDIAPTLANLLGIRLANSEGATLKLGKRQ
jgi:predicted AlkP superfamily pyrophosphatase or phosphodiesterase